MFRVIVRIDATVLEKYFKEIKTGLPGIAYIKYDKNTPWPESLSTLPKRLSE